MTLDPQHEQADVERHGGHVEDRPQDWGWHAEFPKFARIAGFVVAIIMILMILPAHYNGQGALFLGLTAGVLIVGLILDRQRRKNAWRQ